MEAGAGPSSPPDPGLETLPALPLTPGTKTLPRVPRPPSAAGRSVAADGAAQDVASIAWWLPTAAVPVRGRVPSTVAPMTGGLPAAIVPTTGEAPGAAAPVVDASATDEGRRGTRAAPRGETSTSARAGGFEIIDGYYILCLKR